MPRGTPCPQDFARFTPREIVDSVLSFTGQRERIRRLRESDLRHDAALAEEFRRSAEAVLRRDPREAGRRARLALLVAGAAADPRGHALCLMERAKAAIHCGTATAALAALEKAARLAERVEDELLGAQIELLRMQPLLSMERYAEARTAGESVLYVFDRRGDRAGRILTNMSLADLAFRTDRPRDALRHYTAVDDLLGSSAPPLARAALAMNRANSLEACNRFRAAARQFARARELFASAGSEHSVAQVDYNTAYGEMLRGRFRDALRRYAACEDAFRRLGDDRHLAHIELDRAEIHVRLRLPEDAATSAEAAETRFRRLGLVKECAQSAYLRGRALEMRGDAGRAAQAFAAAEALFAELRLADREAECVLARAELAERKGSAAEARRLAAAARAKAADGCSALSRARIDLLDARLDLATGDAPSAIARAAEVHAACRRIHAPWLHAEALRIVGRAHVALDRLAPAAEAFRRAIDEIEQDRGGVPPDEHMSAYLGGCAAIYEDLVDALILTGDAASAFEYAERARSRALVDLLAARRDADVPSQGDTPSDRRLRYLQERLNSVYQQIFRKDAPSDAQALHAANETRERARAIEEEITQLLRRRRAESPEEASLHAVDAPGAAAVRADLEPGTVLLEYLVTPRSLCIFAMSREGVRVVRRRTGGEELAGLLRRFRFHVARGERARAGQEHALVGAAAANLAALAEWLVEPLAAAIEGATRLVIVPHSDLHQFPFHALPWGDGCLADRFEVVYAPSAAVYGYCARREATATGAPAVFGLPDEDAPQIGDECRSVAAIHQGARLHLGDAATLARLAEEASRARVLHVATHGMFRREHPMLSSIRLADRWVNLYDVYRLRIRGELVVLSTCESGVATADAANEILGLARGLLYAGAPALLTSQWRVEDGVTRLFMTTFHEALAAGEGAAAAHRRAMARVRAEHPHPYFWAPFFLTGRPVDARAPAQSPSAACAAGESPAQRRSRRVATAVG